MEIHRRQPAAVADGKGQDASGAHLSIYDNALVALLLTHEGRREEAGRILEALAILQRADGSIPFSFPLRRAGNADPYIRSGALAWVGFAELLPSEHPALVWPP